MLGGSREYKLGEDEWFLSFQNEFSLSGVLKMSYLFFNAVTSDTVNRVSGVDSSVLTLDAGLIYRHDFFKNISTGVEFNVSVLSFAVDSATKVDLTEFIFGGFVRF